ncbi:MAG: DUF1538 domain-containing protein [Methylovulum sp.]|nr:DUF1538 domain-containing protein [Methylovulum sp.]
MIDAVNHFLLTLLATCQNMLPIAAIIVVFQFVVIRKRFTQLKKILVGFAFVIFGIAFFLEGLDMALFPLGKLMATQLTAAEFLGTGAGEVLTWRSYAWVYVFAASVGFATTLAEPALLAVAQKAQHISGGTINAWGLRLAVSLGVALGSTLGTVRIITGIELYYLLFAGYAIVMIQTLFTPKLIVALAYDSGPVTTSTVTVPLVTALGLGLASTVPGRNPLLDGFGLVAFAGLFAVIAVLGYAQLAQLLGKDKRSSTS